MRNFCDSSIHSINLNLFFPELDSFINNQSTGDVEATTTQEPEEEQVKELESDKTVVDEHSPMEVAEPVN